MTALYSSQGASRFRHFPCRGLGADGTGEGEQREGAKGLIHPLGRSQATTERQFTWQGYCSEEDHAADRLVASVLGWWTAEGIERSHQAAGILDNGHHREQTSALLWQSSSTAKRPSPVWSYRWQKRTPPASQCYMDPFY